MFVCVYVIVRVHNSKIVQPQTIQLVRLHLLHVGIDNIIFRRYILSMMLVATYLRYGSTTIRGTDGGRNPGVR